MKRLGLLLAVLAGGLLGPWGHGQEKRVVPPLPSTVQVTLPEGNIRIEYAESNEAGMILYVHAGEVVVRARKVYLGDGKIAVPYEASEKGFSTPSGFVNAAAIDLKAATVISYPANVQREWGTGIGVVYLLTESLKFQAKK